MMLSTTVTLSPVATQRPMLTPLAPRRRSPLLSEEEFSSGPVFPNLLAIDLPPSLPDIIDIPTADGNSGRCNYSRGRRTVRGPPPTPTLRPRRSHFNPRSNTSSEVIGAAAAAAEPMPSPQPIRSSSSTLPPVKTIPQKRRPSLVKVRRSSSISRAA